jgi:hypothetical protein
MCDPYRLLPFIFYTLQGGDVLYTAAVQRVKQRVVLDLVRYARAL